MADLGEGGREGKGEGGWVGYGAGKGGKEGGRKGAHLPHECLSVGANLGDDGTELGLKAHVKHAVSFVQH